MAYEPRLICHMSRFCWGWGVVFNSLLTIGSFLLTMCIQRGEGRRAHNRRVAKQRVTGQQQLQASNVLRQMPGVTWSSFSHTCPALAALSSASEAGGPGVGSREHHHTQRGLAKATSLHHHSPQEQEQEGQNGGHQLVPQGSNLLLCQALGFSPKDME